MMEGYSSPDSEADLPTFQWAQRTTGASHSTTASTSRETVPSDDGDDVCIISSPAKGRKATKFDASARSGVQPSAVVSSQGSASFSRETEGRLTDTELRIERNRLQAREKRRAAMARTAERERVRADKQHQRKMDRAVKEAAREASKERQPAERAKKMVVLLDMVLSENDDFMTHLVPELRTLKVTYCVCGDMHPGSVSWKRIVTDRTVDESAQIHLSTAEKDEGELLVALEGQGLVGLVYHTKQAQCGIPLPSGAQTLQQFVEGLQQEHPGKRVTLAVEGLDAVLRSTKTRLNRQFRQAVASSGTHSAPPTAPVSAPIPAFSSVTKVDCEEALVGLQLTSGCTVRQCANGEQLAEHVITLTRALAEAPFKRESPFSFHFDVGPGASKKALMETDDKVGLVWKHQLMQFKNISEHQAAAIAAVYTSPAQLLRAYESSSDPALLLQDIVVRRGVGTTTSCRRVGPMQSKRIYTLLCSHDPTEITMS